MQFRKCSIAGVSYGKGTTEMGLARLKRLGLPLPPNPNPNPNTNTNTNPNPNPNHNHNPAPNPKQVRNPHAGNEWSGPFSDADEESWGAHPEANPIPKPKPNPIPNPHPNPK